MLFIFLLIFSDIKKKLKSNLNRKHFVIFTRKNYTHFSAEKVNCKKNISAEKTASKLSRLILSMVHGVS